jgi:hypothetical protein
MRMTKNWMGCAILLAIAPVSNGQVDSAQVLVSQSVATGGTSGSPGNIQASAYDAATDTAYVSVVAPAFPTARIRRITNVSTAPVATTVLTDTQLNTWLQRGENRTGSGLPQGLAFNPTQIGSISAGGNLWIADVATISPNDGSTASSVNNDPAACARIYRYNLQDVPTSGATLFDNVNQVLTPLVSKADKQNAAGQTPSTAGDAIWRQPTFSPDGQSLYAVDSGTVMPGIYRMSPLNPGVVTRVTDKTVSVFSEVAVVKVGALDRIYFRSSNNPNALTYVDHNPATNATSAETVALSLTDLQNFMESSGTFVVNSVVADTAGNLYVAVSTGSGVSAVGRLLRLDTSGRLSKVTTREERASGMGLSPTTPAASMQRMQLYSFNHPTAGAITRITSDEVLYGISVSNVFKPCDFNRDGLENAADMALFKSKLGTIGTPSLLADARYDMNGNGSINYKDVKILQSFYGFRNGDANLDRKVDTIDFNNLAGNFGKPSQAVWTEGDFDGNEIVDSIDFNTLAANYGQLPLNAPALGTAVPEPASISLLAVVTTSLLRRRKA